MNVSELLDLFCEALEIDAGSLTLETRIEDVEEWNSLAWLTIMSLLDERLNLQLGSREIRSFKTVNDVVTFIDAKVSLVK